MRLKKAKLLFLRDQSVGMWNRFKKILKIVYASLPFKKELFTIIKKTIRPSQNLYKHLYFKGVFNVSVDHTSFKIRHYGFEIENEIFWRGLENGWEKISVSLWINLCKEANTIIDIGANTGVYSLIASAVKPAAQVIALEPVTRVFEKLQANNKLNHFNINCLPLAASDKNGVAKIFDVPGEHVYSVTVNTNVHQSNVHVIETEIRTITLDTIAETFSLSKIDLIKIDVETHEPEVLKGYEKYLSVHKPTILIEVLTDEVAAKVNNLLQGMGYLFFNINESTGIQQTERIHKSDYFNYLVCSPSIARSLKLVP